MHVILVMTSQRECECDNSHIDIQTLHWELFNGRSFSDGHAVDMLNFTVDIINPVVDDK